MTGPDELLTLQEVADLLKISYRRARQLRAAGEFGETYSIGDKPNSGIRIPRSGVDAYLARHVADGDEEASEDEEETS